MPVISTDGSPSRRQESFSATSESFIEGAPESCAIEEHRPLSVLAEASLAQGEEGSTVRAKMGMDREGTGCTPPISRKRGKYRIFQSAVRSYTTRVFLRKECASD